MLIALSLSKMVISALFATVATLKIKTFRKMSLLLTNKTQNSFKQLLINKKIDSKQRLLDRYYQEIRSNKTLMPRRLLDMP
jgi:predicted solute-binding protein